MTPRTLPDGSTSPISQEAFIRAKLAVRHGAMRDETGVRLAAMHGLNASRHYPYRKLIVELRALADHLEEQEDELEEYVAKLEVDG